MEIDLISIMEGIAKSDRDAFTVLYRHMYKDVFKIAYAKTHDFHTAQDIAHEAFVKIWTKARTFHSDGERNSSARAWIYSITRNQVIDHWRSRKHEMTVGKIETRNDFASQRELDMLHERMDVYTLVEILPRECADVVVLHALGAFTVPECAAHLRISTATVKRRYRKGIELLMKTIESQQS